MISATIEVIYRSYSLFFLYAHLCASLSRFGIGLPVCDNVFKELKCYDERGNRRGYARKQQHFHV
jgi:hypothetical protein